MLAGFHQSLAAVDGQLRDTGVILDVLVVAAGQNLRVRQSTTQFGDLLRALIDQKDEDLHRFVILVNSFGEVLQQRRFSRPGRCHDESALTAADRC